MAFKLQTTRQNAFKLQIARYFSPQNNRFGIIFKLQIVYCRAKKEKILVFRLQKTR